MPANWPEFGDAGKGDLTVADLMRHEAGLAAFNTTLDPEDLLPDNIRQNAVGRVIEPHPQKYREGEGQRREYHAITRGWIATRCSGGSTRRDGRSARSCAKR